jgi:hypothetical protein
MDGRLRIMASDRDYNLRVFLDEAGTPPYKGFATLRQRPYFLFEIKPREGFDLPASLSGKFTKLELLHQAIDHYLAETDNSADTAYAQKITRRPRGRPKKEFITNEHTRNNLQHGV